MPESGGIALGIDRLAMLFCGVDKIEDVLWCGKV
jgi:elongation factor P--beta-lysine ligase